MINHKIKKLKYLMFDMSNILYYLYHLNKSNKQMDIEYSVADNDMDIETPVADIIDEREIKDCVIPENNFYLDDVSPKFMISSSGIKYRPVYRRDMKYYWFIPIEPYTLKLRQKEYILSISYDATKNIMIPIDDETDMPFVECGGVKIIIDINYDL
jgi:hypothetical protein